MTKFQGSLTLFAKGFPPSCGWWPTMGTEPIRWWNGKHWSTGVRKTASAAAAGLLAKIVFLNDQEFILWLARPLDWPARSFT